MGSLFNVQETQNCDEFPELGFSEDLGKDKPGGSGLFRIVGVSRCVEGPPSTRPGFCSLLLFQLWCLIKEVTK